MTDMKRAAALVALPMMLGLNACAGSTPLPPKAVALSNDAALNIARGDLDRAQSEAKIALEYNPKFIEATFNLGLVEFERGNYVAARDHFLKARTLNRDLPWGSFGLGLIADVTHQAKEAEGYYRDALSINPGFTEARMNLASVLTKQKKVEAAYAELKKCAEIAPSNAELWVMLIKTGIQLNRFSDLDDIVKGAALHLRKPEASVIKALRLLAQNRVDVGAVDEAERILNGARAKAPAAWQTGIDAMLQSLPDIRRIARSELTKTSTTVSVYIRP